MSGTNGAYSSYSSYGGGGAYGGGGQHAYGGSYGAATDASMAPPAASATLRRRHADAVGSNNGHASFHSNEGNAKSHGGPRTVVKSLDFMFPKVDQEFTIQTDRGGVASLVAIGLIVLLCLAETVSWYAGNRATTEHVAVDTSLGRHMRVNLNVTFPALSCDDLHVDVMDVAGDSQLDIDNTLTKTRLMADGISTGRKESVESNIGRKRQSEIDRVMAQKDLPDDYCGPCYGAQENDSDCCNTCDEVLSAYRKKKWKADMILKHCEQCIREGRHATEPKRMTKGEGCNLVGYMTINRVAGNFHIAMGEGVERNGRHIHTFQPDDTENFNASHIIHHLSFGNPTDHKGGITEDHPLNGVTKIVNKERGTTGLFQYFIKIVPTTYVSRSQERRESNGYFFTERFRPLMQEYFDDDDDDETTSKDGLAEAEAGTAGGHGHHGHHDVKKNSILPGVFFVYEIYPFAVEISENSVPWTHLIIRLMATVGGVLTVMRLVDTFVLEPLSR